MKNPAVSVAGASRGLKGGYVRNKIEQSAGIVGIGTPEAGVAFEAGEPVGKVNDGKFTRNKD